MEKKISVGVLFGGRSAEHEVSVRSAHSLLEAIDRDKYDVTLIGIDREGRWLLPADAAKMLTLGKVEGDGTAIPVALDYSGSRQLVLQNRTQSSVPSELDIVFPLLHGPFGEDGTVQGFLELADVAYVGSGVLGSAVSMDKDMMKRVLRAGGIPQVAHAAVLRSRWRACGSSVQEEIERDFTYPLFVKPANLGSSVGISKVHEGGELAPAMEAAARYDRKIIIEADAGHGSREVECSVLGYENPIVSVVGEVLPAGEFYDYDAKYKDSDSELIIPAHLDQTTTERVQQLAKQTFLAVEAAGLARVDLFVQRDGTVIVNEINTIPGFTPISMYPKLWAASGISYTELIDRLLELAVERHRDRSDSTTDHNPRG
jgi:D-alanine-D-alanine ligase